jgi:hydroxymethylglutaryl-CoA lyase
MQAQSFLAAGEGRRSMSLTPAIDAEFSQTMGLPERVKIVEVGPRDGLQNQSGSISVDDKVALVNRLSRCGFQAIEVGSFVSPKAVPQMADSDRVYRQIDKHRSTNYIMLVADEKGLKKAIDCRVNNIAVFCAATDAFSLKNIHCTAEESLVTIQSICEQARAEGMNIKGYVSCVLGCPYQGEVDLQRVGRLAAELYEFGCREISLGDTIGAGTPGMVTNLIAAVAQHIPIDTIAVHFHDTYGQALANILSALQVGISIVDSSVGGLGGCPFAPGASGNVASEDVVYMLNGLGIETGIDLNRLVSTSWFVAEILHGQPASKVSMALKNRLVRTAHPTSGAGGKK